MLVLTAAGVVVAGAVGTAVALGVGGRGEAAPDRSGLPPATEPVTVATLTDHTEVDGTLGYGDAAEVAGRGGGIVTWLPAAGAVLERGAALYRADELPVTVLYGALPAYRPLADGTEGADVRQFEENLAALGFTGFTVDDSYTDRTADAVRDWQSSLGRDETGTVDPAQIAYVAGPVRVAELLARPGDQAGGPLLRLTGTGRVITIDLPVSDQQLAVAGAAVTVTLPDGATVEGAIASVGTAVTQPDSEQPGADTTATIEVVVTVADQAALGGYDQAPVEVGLTAETREHVLTVPIAALLALSEGGYGVELVEGAASRIVAVDVGMFADGRVEVSGVGVVEGALVGVPT